MLAFTEIASRLLSNQTANMTGSSLARILGVSTLKSNRNQDAITADFQDVNLIITMKSL